MKKKCVIFIILNGFIAAMVTESIRPDGVFTLFKCWQWWVVLIWPVIAFNWGDK